MTKKNYLIIGCTIVFFVIVIIFILVTNNNKDWTSDIKKSASYEIVMTDCEGRQKTLDNNVLNTISNKWKKLSNNGPWTGNINNCYPTVTISYENKGIIQKKEILIIDNSSIVLTTNSGSTYYVNATDINNYLKGLFNSN